MTPKYIGHFHGALLHRMGECAILLSGQEERDQIGWHFSISCPARNPTWEEQRDARYALVPDDVYMVSILPPKKEYINAHKFTFHWWQAGPKFFDVKTGRPTG